MYIDLPSQVEYVQKNKTNPTNSFDSPVLKKISKMIINDISTIVNVIFYLILIFYLDSKRYTYVIFMRYNTFEKWLI